MFTVGTILERKEKKNNPYDKVKIVGLDPLKSPDSAEWAAAGNHGILVQPVDSFGNTATIPFEKLSNNFKIIEEADGMPVAQTDSGGSQESPEAAFARVAMEDNEQTKQQSKQGEEKKGAANQKGRSAGSKD